MHKTVLNVTGWIAFFCAAIVAFSPIYHITFLFLAWFFFVQWVNRKASLPPKSAP